MAKSKKNTTSDWAVVLVLVLLILATNLYWLLATREMDQRLDNHANAVLQLQDCYNDGTKPCN